MKVIVIVVTYNGMQWYPRCFDSLRQSTIAVQTIAIDNNSSDSTVAFIKDNYPEVKLVESKANLGFGKANNIGFKYALEENADYVFLLNQDAWLDANTIEELIKAQQNNTEYGILSPIHLNAARDEIEYHFALYVDPRFCPSFISDYVVKGKAEDKVYNTLFVHAALWLISKECLHKTGGFAPIFPHYGEDDNYGQRALYHGFKIGIYPMVHGVHDKSSANTKKPPRKKKTQREIIAILVEVMDIRQSLFSSYYKKCFIKLLNEFISYTLQLKVKKMGISIYKSAKLFCLLPTIVRERNISKKAGTSFLD